MLQNIFCNRLQGWANLKIKRNHGLNMNVFELIKLFELCTLIKTTQCSLIILITKTAVDYQVAQFAKLRGSFASLLTR